MDAGGRSLASLVTNTLRLDREVSFVNKEEGSKAQWAAPEKSRAVF